MRRRIFPTSIHGAKLNAGLRGHCFVKDISIDVGWRFSAATAIAPVAANAGSLAGSEGDKRYPVRIFGKDDQCAKGYRQYVAHNGHAAYAQNAATWGAEGFFCGIATGPTQKAAEERALAGCKSLGKKYKMKTIGRCEVYASK